ncbi:MAG: hypothetical protein KKG92_10520, partial [Gammaproteobacteria bacterium]|nr:hypothetical protein [Gammaproteobacteria bacterium]
LAFLALGLIIWPTPRRSEKPAASCRRLPTILAEGAIRPLFRPTALAFLALGLDIWPTPRRSEKPAASCRRLPTILAEDAIRPLFRPTALRFAQPTTTVND